MLLYVASSNPGKLREFATSAGAAGIEVAPLPGLCNIVEPMEDALTFMGNAELKARAYSLAVPGKLVLADDSGLAVEALDGAPGVRSARFAEDHRFQMGSGRKIDDRNNDLLLDRIKFTSGFADRTAHYVCALALARDGQIVQRTQAACDGEILHSPRGAGGFGYDSLFYIPQLDATMAELAPETKWKISHRGQAFRALLAQLQPC